MSRSVFSRPANGWVVLAMAIALFGAVIHVAAVAGGPSWYQFFDAPPFIVASARAGTWLAPVGGMVIAALMALCAAYAASALGLVRRLPLLRAGLASMATVCLLRALVLIPFVFKYPQLLNTFQVVASTVWGLAGTGFAVGFLAARRLPLLPRHRRPKASGLQPLADGQP